MASAKSSMMARRKSNYRFLSNDLIQPPSMKTSATTELEFDESDIWGVSTRSDSPPSWSKSSRKSMTAPTPARGRRAGDASSLPVNIPDWSKILREEYKAHKWSFGEDLVNDCYGGDDDGEGWVAPHEYLARPQMASLSLHEGSGRTLTGRDLNKVRNAILEKTGFQD
ncbi:hypothetical protein SOVF_124490 [Spinacia oleracea]|uniref:Protein S40-4 n=1 Tax=Spinacia oleracea TaxID=3562 RepID=A0A9R0IZU2_SPIOL|nr:protein S40-4-like [Spinacia oleracea]KNA12583.1 hypothetical protein SOVF_124490 [Spinacia oleracea]